MMEPPSPNAIKAARAASGLTQAAAAALVYSTERAWQKWEGGDRRMHPAVFELFCIKSRSAMQDYLRSVDAYKLEINAYRSSIDKGAAPKEKQK